MKKEIDIDIYSDTVCPWCYIGLNKLKLATATKVTAVLVESDDTLIDRNKEVNEFRMTVDKAKLSNKNFTLVLIHT